MFQNMLKKAYTPSAHAHKHARTHTDTHTHARKHTHKLTGACSAGTKQACTLAAQVLCGGSAAPRRATTQHIHIYTTQHIYGVYIYVVGPLHQGLLHNIYMCIYIHIYIERRPDLTLLQKQRGQATRVHGHAQKKTLVLLLLYLLLRLGRPLRLFAAHAASPPT